MGQIQRASHMDVSNTVDVSNPGAVEAAVLGVLGKRYPLGELTAISILFSDFNRLYEGLMPGYRACDIRYHNVEHVLDVTLAMARLLDGCWPVHPMSVDQVLAGIAAALFHDSGYIRRTRDSRNKNGGAYTRVHVSRSARFIAQYLPRVGLAHLVDSCTRMVYFTRYDASPAELHVADEAEFVLGSLLGTADIMAQMADSEYARKCSEYLFEEFVEGGLATAGGSELSNGARYSSAEELLRLTPGFIRDAIDIHLNGHFNHAHLFAAEHFDGRHLYMDAIEDNRRNLERLLAGRES